MHATGSDHPVFTRLTRAQKVIRRRHIGFQALILTPPLGSAPPDSIEGQIRYCSYCHRVFNPLWKPYLCHVCGHWVCEPCSRVLEREREELVIRFVRSCERCFPLLNKWTVDVESLAEFTFSPWLVQSSVSPLGANLAEILRSRPEWRQAALSLLQHLGREIETLEGVKLEDIGESEWSATISASSALSNATEANERIDSRLTRGAQHFVQQCLDVRVSEVPLEKCTVAEIDGRRGYSVTYTSPLNPPLLSTDPMEAMRENWIARYRLQEEDNSQEEVALICDLVAKELGSNIGIVGVISGDRQWFIPTLRKGKEITVNDRKHAFSSHVLLSETKPLLVRNAQFDIRFRNFKSVTAENGISFFFGVPILAPDGVIVATLLAVDPKPRRSITTMQYSVVTALAEVISSVWRKEFELVGRRKAGEDCPSILEDQIDVRKKSPQRRRRREKTRKTRPKN